MTEKTYLATVYDLKGDKVREYYDDWAKSYEDEVAQNAYATPDRCATALVATDLPKDAPILDFACGTGLSGVALAKAGFTKFDGIDISQGMLEQAEAKGIYRTLTTVSGDAPPPVMQGAYQAITAMGAIGPGAAPASVIAPLAEALLTGGYFVFSLNDVAMNHPEFAAAIEAQADTLTLITKDHGAHLPGIDVKATVFTFQKA
ncbi:MAG: methyltransferase domain-containing protein [Pseudomonadota bacterium]